MDSKLKLGLMGNPISHSKSPALFNAAYTNSNFTYSLIEANTAEKAFELFTKENFIGANVTSPFKDDIMAFVDMPSNVSKFLGSANTIIHRKGKIYCDITDYFGVRNTIRDYIATTGNNIKSALIIGSGGAGKAAALATKNLGLKTIISNRSIDKGISFTNSLNDFTGGENACFISLDDIAFAAKECSIIIYTLSKIGRAHV